ncbi:MAG: hypothetical protein A3J29_23100 [Acidobacteria bacterium RIFCSPLOWO2_12_FULL_67_14b]|nr:MAG: hypothetical protein A3I61_13495 [Acidobacteria bacterium RIFCSPLOWO2_02_FULL_68_18]OFW45397.1 MAG: hypothetical protein A3J29_23100 [Acidobacteria bacterium RIFCSPLOWO2_12_FULL_67_14b]
MRIIAVLLFTVVTTTAAQTPDLSLQSFLVVGKAAGACGILTQQLTFQETTQMSGGNEFVVRFWTTESARLGMTLEQYAEHCKRSVSAYDKMFQAAEQLK